MTRMTRGIAALSGCALVLGLTVTATAPRAVALDNGLTPTPPMGWNGYNHFSHDVTASIVEAEAREIVSSGMKAAGYQYVNLDGGWDLLQRGPDGQLQPDPARFPDGIKPVADYVHSLGLKFGIYTSAGTANCADTSAGSYGHYRQDADTFASWGVDYVKFDRCDVPYDDYPDLTHPEVTELLATQMHDAIEAAGRPMVFDVNDARQAEHDWTWAPPIANLWRVAGDISDSYSSMVNNFRADVTHAPDVASGGGWSDPDMLEVGNGGMTSTEDQSQFSLWAELAAPLIAGNDLTRMTPATRNILTNADVIAIDQDPLGKQGYPVASTDGHWVLTKPLAGGERAVVLFNQGDVPARISTTAAQVGLADAPAYTLHDLWTGATTETTGPIDAEVPAHGVVMYRVASTTDFGAYPPGTMLQLSAPGGWVPAAGPATVTASFTNDGRLPLRQVRLALHVPPGWTVTGPVDFAAIATGATVVARWQVTAGSNPGCLAPVDVRATYLWGDIPSPGSASQSATIAVACPLTAAFDNTGISDDAAVDSANFDGVGDSYSEQALTAAGLAPGAAVSHDGVTFTWPDVPAGQPDNVLAEGQTVLVSGSGSTLGFLGSSSGTGGGTGTVYYTDGTTSSFTLTLHDYWSPPDTGNDIIAATPYLNSQGIGGRPRGQRQHTVYVFYAGVPITPGKTVQAVDLPAGASTAAGRISGMHVFAIAIGG